MPAPMKRARLPFVVLGLLGLCGVAAAPAPVGPNDTLQEKNGSAPKKGEFKTAVVPFGGVVIALADEGRQRHLRMKLALVVDAAAEKSVTDLVAKKKAAVKSELLVHLAGKSTKDVSGSVGVQRMQRELLERIEDVLYHDGNSRIRAVLFEEYVVQ